MNTKWLTSIVLAGVAISSHAQATPTTKQPHVFFDRYNVALFSADALVRSLDAQSTRSFMTNPCHCMSETTLPDSIAGSTPKMYAYSLGVSAGVVGLTYLAHKTGHHKIERIIPMVDIGYSVRNVSGNYVHINQANEMYKGAR